MARPLRPLSLIDIATFQIITTKISLLSSIKTFISINVMLSWHKFSYEIPNNFIVPVSKFPPDGRNCIPVIADVIECIAFKL